MTEELRKAIERVIEASKKALIRGAQVPEPEVEEVEVEVPGPEPTVGPPGPAED